MSLDQLTNLLASVTLFEMMVAIGLGVSVGDVLRVATHWPLVAKAALASYVCVPAAAVGLLILFQANPYVAAGFLIAAVCPGAPYGPPFTGMAKGNVVVSVGLMVILAGSSALAAPLLLQVLLPWTLQFLPPLPADSPPLAIDAVKVVRTLLIAQFLPLCIGLAVRQWCPSLADTLKKPANVLSMVLNLTLLGLIFSVQFDMLIGIPLRGFLGMFLLVLAGVVAGWLLAGWDNGNRSAMVMATSVRNVGVGLVIATGAFAGTRAVAATTAFAIFQTVVMAVIALGWGRLVSGSPEPTTTAKMSTDEPLTGVAPPERPCLEKIAVSKKDEDRPKMKRKEYEKELRKLQTKLCQLQDWVVRERLRVIVVFEGRDAAGKGGTIKALMERVSPRVFHLVALPAPSDREKTQMYAQRYMQHFPAAGEVVIFDRSWYNRAGVEYVMGFCTKDQYKAFVENCPKFESHVIKAGIILIKFWLEVGQKEQQRRFEARIEDPLRQWKLSPMDVESYARWYAYSRARDMMLEATDTKDAPWHIIRSDDKERARLNCIAHFLRLIPHKKVEREKVKLPKRSDKGKYDDQATLENRNFVPETH